MFISVLLTFIRGSQCSDVFGIRLPSICALVCRYVRLDGPLYSFAYVHTAGVKVTKAI